MSDALAARRIRLRPVREDDLPWLRDLYASTRDEEMQPVPWPAPQKRAFLDQQFAMQQRHYLDAFGDADFLAVCREHAPVGRLYLRRSAPSYLIIDISLFPHMRGQGIGAALIRAAQRQAAMQECGVALHVLQQNAAARKLYERLGFVAREASFPYLKMDWRSPSEVSRLPSAP